MCPRVLCYIGTYTHTTSEGIYLYEVDLASGSLNLVNVSPAGDHPSYLAFHPNGRTLYAVNETEEYGGKASGAVSAYAISPQTGALTFLNRQASEGASPCYVSVDATGQCVLVANYHGGNIAVLPVQADGQLLPVSDLVQFRPTEAESQRKKVPHGHCIIPDATNRFVLACDAGLDRLMIYRLDLARGRLIPNEQPTMQLREGAAPRHVTIHPNRRYVYAIGESSSTLFALAWDEVRGTLAEIQAIGTLPGGFNERSYCADLHIHPSGRFLYGSNRGHNSIVIYALDDTTGKLTLVGHESTQGQIPRNLALDPTGQYLFAANQRSDTVVSYRIDLQTGKLAPRGTCFPCRSPCA
jgi:6-phosphogluconolactonase